MPAYTPAYGAYFVVLPSQPGTAEYGEWTACQAR